MNGAMFNSLARFVEKNYPEVSFSDLCQKASLRTNIFAELTWYPDKDFFNLMDILSDQTQKSETRLGKVTTLWREFGKETFAYFAEIFSDYMKNVTSLDQMLTTINKIHYDISKDGLGTPPRFEFKKVSGNHFEIKYTSNRNLGDFFLGMLEEAAKYFETSVKIIGRKERGKLVASITVKQPEMMPVSW
jgi:hypothetical protein